VQVDTRYYAPDFLITVDDKPFRHGVNIDILSISITETHNRADTFQFNVRARHEQIARFPSGQQLKWIDDNQFKVGNKVEIAMGYVNNLGVKLTGAITAVAVNFAENGTPTVSVQGQSRYNQLQRERRYAPFASRRDSDIVREIARQCKLNVEVEETNTEHETVSPRGRTLAAILQERAERLNFEVSVKEDTLFFRQPSYLANATPTLTLTWGQSLLSFSPRLATGGTPTAVRVRSTQTARGGEKKPLVTEIRADDEPARLGLRSGPQIVREAFGDNILLVEDHRAESPEENQRVCRARMQRSAIEFVQGDGATIGNPQLQSSTVIELHGLGEKFSGRYYVTSTTHTIDANGYRTTFHAKRDGI